MKTPRFSLFLLAFVLTSTPILLRAQNPLKVDVAGNPVAGQPLNVGGANITGTLPSARLPGLAQSVIAYGYRDSLADATNAIDSRIIGKSPGAGYTDGSGNLINIGSLNIFYSGNYTTGTGYVRNDSLWCADFAGDLTCFSPWNSREGAYQGGTLITPKHAIFAEHFSGTTGSYPMQAGDHIIFIGKTGTRYVRTLAAAPVRVGTSDTCIGTFTETDLPSDVQPATALPPSAIGFLTAGTPVIYTNKNKECHIGELGDLTSTTFPVRDPTVSSRAPWDAGTLGISGDSGSPCFVALDGKLILLGLLSGGLGGENLTGYLSSINALLPTGYALKVAALPPRLGTAAARDVIGDGDIPSIDPATGQLSPEVIPPSGSGGGGGGGSSPVEQTFDGTSDVTLSTSTTVLRFNGSALTSNVTVHLPTGSSYGRALDVVVPAFSGSATMDFFQDSNATHVATLRTITNSVGVRAFRLYYGSDSSWRTDPFSDASMLGGARGNFGFSVLAYSSTTTIDFSAEYMQSVTLAGDVTFAAANIASGRSVRLRIVSGGSDRALTFPTNWTFIGIARPTVLAAGKVAVLGLGSFGLGTGNVDATYDLQDEAGGAAVNGVAITPLSVTTGGGSAMQSDGTVRVGSGYLLGPQYYSMRVVSDSGGDVILAPNFTPVLTARLGGGVDVVGVLTASQGITVTPLSSAPSSPTEGQHYYSSSTHKEYVWDGSAWQALW